MSARVTTNISTKGQVVLPKAVRDQHGWRPGDKLEVESRPDSVVLRAVAEHPPTRYDDVAGCLGPAKRKAGVEKISRVSGDYVRKRWGHEYDDLN